MKNTLQQTQTILLPNIINNQGIIHIGIENLGDNDDRCYFGNILLEGNPISISISPTKLPTMFPTNILSYTTINNSTKNITKIHTTFNNMTDNNINVTLTSNSNTIYITNYSISPTLWKKYLILLLIASLILSTICILMITLFVLVLKRIKYKSINTNEPSKLSNTNSQLQINIEPENDIQNVITNGQSVYQEKMMQHISYYIDKTDSSSDEEIRTPDPDAI